MADKEIIDIEALLVRAYRQYAVDRVTPERIMGLSLPAGNSVSNMMIVCRHMALGTFIDSSPRAAVMLGSATDAAAVPEDLLAVHDAVLGLDGYYLERAGTECLVWDGETAERAGLRIERKGSDWFICPKDDTGALQGLHERRVSSINTSVMVILHARAATRPHVDELVEVERRPIYRGARKQAVGHEVIYATSPEAIAIQKAEYQVWHCALGLLAAQLKDLARFDVTGPAAPLEPWNEEVIHRQRTMLDAGV